MIAKHATSDTELLEEAARKAKHQKYVLRLYVAGMTPRSREALRTVSEICREELAGRCDLEVIDLYKQPTLAHREQIVAVPTLIKKLPLPLRRFIGSMVDKEKLLVGLDLIPRTP
ncbi:MAG: circadian clock KaiB family protein [Planctomycetes bacterium]|nr:circadian clock KaiB family protein [Planctomycetota bacterium]